MSASNLSYMPFFWTLPKTFIDATKDPDPYLDAVKEAEGAKKQ